MAFDDASQANSLVKVSDLGETPQAKVKRWTLEIKLADKRESKWRETAKKIYTLYTPPEPAKNSFNILWTNTETLRHAVYNSIPQPDARRRYSDEDPLGDKVGQVLTRALEFSQDTYDFDGVLKGDVLCALLAGRGLSRVKYVPDIRTVDTDDSGDDETIKPDSDEDDDSVEGEEYEEIEWEQTICERVHWEDFRILCAARTWDEVTAIGFRHRFTYEDLEDKFGEEIAKAVPLDGADDEDVKKSKDVADLFKTAEVWEIWDKDAKEVIWIAKNYSDQPCKEQEDPLELSGFFPIPRPLYAIENDSTLVPAALYTQYEVQAKQLNKLSLRIEKMEDALRVRGIYDATLTELEGLMQSSDNGLIPAQNVTALLERGGLEKAIWMLPIDTLAVVLKELYAARDHAKQVIYEITGISDIMRSATDAQETATAQRIKTQWGTQRLQRLQLEVQRYIRDLIRLKAEIIAEKFQPETLEKMTLLEIPHKHDVDMQFQQQVQQYQQQMQQAHQQYAMQAQQAQQQGQQPPAPPQHTPPPQYPNNIITWEKVTEAMRDDATRTYRIDIETDSTIASTENADLDGLKNAIASVVQVNSEMMPLVQQGALPWEAVKELMLAVSRKARLGTAVEDAVGKMTQPPPPPDPNAAKNQQDAQLAQAQAQQEQQKMQMQGQLEQAKMQAAAQTQQLQMQHEQQLEQIKAKNQAQVMELQARANQASEQARMEADAQVEQARAAASIEVEKSKQLAQFQIDEATRSHAANLQMAQHSHDSGLSMQQVEFDKWKAELDAATKIAVAEISAKVTMGTSLLQAQNSANATLDAAMPQKGNLEEIHAQTLGAIQQLTQTLAKPKKVVRDANNRIIGTE